MAVAVTLQYMLTLCNSNSNIVTFEPPGVYSGKK